MPYAPVLDEFLKKDNRGRPLKVRVKNTARIRIIDHSQKPTPGADTELTLGGAKTLQGVLKFFYGTLP